MRSSGVEARPIVVEARSCHGCGKPFEPAADLADIFGSWLIARCAGCSSQAVPPRPVEAAAAVLARANAGPQTGLFTGGFCHPNPGPGAWSVVRVAGEAIVTESSGSCPATTVNRMAMQSIIEALHFLSPSEAAVVYSNSETSVNTLKTWAPEWRRNGWRRGPKREPVSNLDLVREALELYERHPNTRLVWLGQPDRAGWLAYADSLSRWQLYDALETGSAFPAGSDHAA